MGLPSCAPDDWHAAGAGDSRGHMRRIDAFFSATLAGVVTAGTSMSALLNQVKSFDDITGPAWAMVLIGAVVTMAKDLQTRYSPARRNEGDLE